MFRTHIIHIWRKLGSSFSPSVGKHEAQPINDKSVELRSQVSRSGGAVGWLIGDGPRDGRIAKPHPKAKSLYISSVSLEMVSRGLCSLFHGDPHLSPYSKYIPPADTTDSYLHLPGSVSIHFLCGVPRNEENIILVQILLEKASWPRKEA